MFGRKQLKLPHLPRVAVCIAQLRLALLQHPPPHSLPFRRSLLQACESHRPSSLLLAHSMPLPAPPFHAGPALLCGRHGRPAGAVPLHLLPLCFRHRCGAAHQPGRPGPRVHQFRGGMGGSGLSSSGWRVIAGSRMAAAVEPSLVGLTGMLDGMAALRAGVLCMP